MNALASLCKCADSLEHLVLAHDTHPKTARADGQNSDLSLMQHVANMTITAIDSGMFDTGITSRIS